MRQGEIACQQLLNNSAVRCSHQAFGNTVVPCQPKLRFNSVVLLLASFVLSSLYQKLSAKSNLQLLVCDSAVCRMGADNFWQHNNQTSELVEI